MVSRPSSTHLLCPSLPCFALLCCLALAPSSGPRNVVSISWSPGHTLHERGLPKQIGVGPLVSSQERRTAVVPRINRLSTGFQKRVERRFGLPMGSHRISLARASGKTFRTSLVWKLAVSLLERVDGSRTPWGRGSRVR